MIYGDTAKHKSMIYTGAKLERQLGGGGGGVNIIHLISAREGNSFVFPRDATFPKTKLRKTLRFEGRQN